MHGGAGADDGLEILEAVPSDPGNAGVVDPPDPADEELRRTLERYETIFSSAPVGIGIVHPDGHLLLSNETLRTLLGYSAEEFGTMPWTDYTHPDDVARNLELHEQMAAGDIDSFEVEKRFVCKDGTLLWASLTSSMVRKADGSPDYVIGMVQDISERQRLERELRNAEQQFRLLVERVPAVVYVSDVGAQAQWHYVSPGIEAMLGFTAEEWKADPHLWLRQLHPEDRGRALAAEESVVELGEERAAPHSDSYRMFHRDGRMVWVRDDALAVWDADGHVSWHGVLVDITREKHLEERLGHQAFHDALTGLPNRVLFHERVGEALARMELTRGSVAVMFVDLDHFKTVNDSFGHAYGDKVIVTAARRIRACVRSGDTAARLGGDEFALLLEGSSTPEVEDLADRVLEALRQEPMRLGDLTVTVSASVGIAVAAPGDTTDTLLRNADLAMYRAKRGGRGRHFRYHEGLHDEVVQRFRVEEALQSAVAGDQIALAYQPIVDTGTGAVAGLEALARWTDPVLGVVPPSEFVPVAERTGLIRDLGWRVITGACRGLAEWRGRTGGNAYVSVNVSPLQLDDDFPALVAENLRDHGLTPDALVLEVTEGLLLAESGRASIRELRTRGIRVAIDDFGTGYSSLSYLRELPVDMVKVDQVFLRPGPDGTEDHTLLHAVVRLADSLRLTTICEGVETAEQLATLGRIGCPFAQGYLLGRPGPLSDVPASLPLPARPDRPPAPR